MNKIIFDNFKHFKISLARTELGSKNRSDAKPNSSESYLRISLLVPLINDGYSNK